MGPAQRRDQHRALRDRLVDELEGSGHIHSRPVADAFRAVPRHVFVPGVEPERVYRDEHLVTKSGPDGRPLSSSSQPAITAIMLEQLGLEPGHRVLEIGAGTGYNAALIAHAVGVSGAVVSVDIDADLVRRARVHLDTAGLGRVVVACGDGGYGWAKGAPYDRIILTVGAWDVAPAWVEQLASGGRLVLPLSLRGAQRSVAFERADGHLDSVSIRDCGFMRLRGALAGPEAAVAVGPDPGLFVEIEDERAVDTQALYTALGQRGADLPTGVHVTPDDVWGGLGLWLALREPELGRLTAIGPAVDRGLVPRLIGLPQQVFTHALLGRKALAVLMRRRESVDPPDSFELAVRALGRDAGDLAARLVGHVRAWDAGGRLSTDRLRVAAYPRMAIDIVPDIATVIEKHHVRLAVEWQPTPAEDLVAADDGVPSPRGQSSPE